MRASVYRLIDSLYGDLYEDPTPPPRPTPDGFDVDEALNAVARSARLDPTVMPQFKVGLVNFLYRTQGMRHYEGPDPNGPLQETADVIFVTRGPSYSSNILSPLQICLSTKSSAATATATRSA